MDTERRRAAGAASARSLLLTVLGEFVLPHDGWAWTGAVVSGLATVGVEEKATRQALARTAAEELLRAERDGRRTRWHLTAAGTRLLTEGAERIYGAGVVTPEWDGRWLVLAVSVPESQRRLRHQLRTRLTWAGLGSPLPGLWVTPDAAKEEAVAAVVEELAVGGVTFVGPFGAVGDERQVVADAWDLAAVEQRYREFLAAFGAEPRGEAFPVQVQLVQQWRRFPFLDPGLPARLLPASWPGPAAAALFAQRHGQWHAGAQSTWEQLQAEAAGRS